MPPPDDEGPDALDLAIAAELEAEAGIEPSNGIGSPEFSRRSRESNAANGRRNARISRASKSLTDFLLDLDESSSLGEAPTEEQIATVVLRETLQLLCDPDLPVAARQKAIEHLTSLRSKKLVQPATPADGLPSAQPNVSLPT